MDKEERVRKTITMGVALLHNSTDAGKLTKVRIESR